MAGSMNWQPNLEGIAHPAVAQAIRQVYNSLRDHDNAIGTLAAKVSSAPASSSSAAASTAQGLTTSDVRAIVQSITVQAAATSPAFGGVNVQPGSYTIQQTDAGVLVAATSAGTITLNSQVAQGFVCALENAGSGSVVVVPDIGTVNGGNAFTLSPGQGAWVYWSGSAWWALTSLAQVGFVNPMAAAGDLIVGGASGSPGRLGIGANGAVLTSNGSSASWQALPSGTGGGGNGGGGTSGGLYAQTNGYQVFTSGLILQWGTTGVFDTGPQTQTFPMAFPSSCLNVTMTDDANTGTTGRVWGVSNATQTGFDARNDGNGSAFWMAIGS